jgi:murein DD-endopeptidase MepM/ murein hydrolase activator NlpD
MMKLLITLLILNATAAFALEVRFQPGDVLYVYENAGEGTPTDLYTAVIQNVAFVNESDGAVTVERIQIEVEKDGTVVLTLRVGDDVLAQAAQMFHTYQEHGALTAYDFQFQTSRYLQGVSFPASTTLGPGEAIVVRRQALLFTGLPDRVTVIVNGRDAEEASISARASLKVVDHDSPNEYFFPVRGRWIAAAAPSLHSHHRWASIQEFAFDLIRMGEGGLSHRGDGTQLDQFYAYGQTVYAIGDGVVVSVRDSMTESDQNLQQPGESAEAYFERSLADQQKLLAQGFSYVLGNHVIIEHPRGEYSHYLHLQHGSVQVKIGDRVSRGQPIARLGHSGNSTEPHLHFHVSNGPDLAYSRSLPVEFANVSLWPADDGTVRHLQSGQVVMTEE